MMHQIALTGKNPHSFVVPYAEFHLGKAFFQGYGVRESEDEAEK